MLTPKSEIRDPKSPIRLLYTGAINDMFYDTMESLCDQLNAGMFHRGAPIELTIYSSACPKRFLGPHVNWGGFVDHEEIPRLLSQADILLVAVSFSQEQRIANLVRTSLYTKTIDYLVLTHAHLDHTGWLPVLARDGYKKPIYANPATIELMGLLLKDSGHLQEEETQNAIKNKWSKHPDPRALYTADDVTPVLAQLKPMARKGGFDLSPEFHFESYDAGHILGSSSLELTMRRMKRGRLGCLRLCTRVAPCSLNCSPTAAIPSGSQRTVA